MTRTYYLCSIVESRDIGLSTQLMYWFTVEIASHFLSNQYPAVDLVFITDFPHKYTSQQPKLSSEHL